MNANIQLHGHTLADLDDALLQVRRLIAEGFISGHDSNETGSFTLSVEGPPVRYYRIKRKGRFLKRRYFPYDDAHYAAKAQDFIYAYDDDEIEVPGLMVKV